MPNGSPAYEFGYNSSESEDEDEVILTEDGQQSSGEFPIKEYLQANKESVESITQAHLFGGSTLNNIQPRWTDADGDCAFHALNINRRDFIEEVNRIYDDPTDKLYNELQRLFSTYDFRREYGDFNNWYARLNGRVWAGDFELNLIGLIRNIQIRIFGLGDNLFEQRYTVGVPNAPGEVWVAFVNMEPVTTANEHDGNHYIELQLPQPGFEHIPAQQNAPVVPVGSIVNFTVDNLHGRLGVPVPPPSFL